MFCLNLVCFSLLCFFRCMESWKNNEIVGKKTKKEATLSGLPLLFGLAAAVVRQPYKPNYCMTVTRFTTTPFSVLMRTMYMPALNWPMLRTISSALTSVS